MKTTSWVLAWAAWSVSAALAAAQPVRVEGTETGTHPRSGVALASGKLTLPFEGYWHIDGPLPAGGAVSQAFLVPPPEVARQTAGRRVSDLEARRLQAEGSSALRQFWWPALEFARHHAGEGPATVEDVVGEKNKWLAESLRRCPYGDGRGAQAPFLALVPKVKFLFPGASTNSFASPTNSAILAVELTPIYDDGLHWVLKTNGHVERVAVDHGLLKTLGVSLRPILPKPAPPDAPPPATATYTVVGLRGAGNGPVRLSLKNSSGARLEAEWPLGNARPGDAQAMAREWGRQRLFTWFWLAGETEAPVFRHWMAAAQRQYDLAVPESPGGNRRRERHQTSLFNVLGGRAAMQETFQLDELPDVSAGATNRSVAANTLPGVAVKSHPFEEMLAGQPGGRLPLAEALPADRLMFYSAKPALLIPMLKDGADFLGRAGATAVGRSLVYDLRERYLARLGLSRAWAEQVLASGLVTELAVTAPDLFLVDGTELTLVARAPNLGALTPVLSLIGIKGLGKTPVAVPAGTGKAWWAVSGDLLVAGTCEAEVRAVLDLQAAGGAGSLGQSAEFRYMLTQLPVQRATRAYLYFSDAFIRRLVGPEVKLGQLRRVVAKANMEAATAAALLWRLDGHKEPPTLPALAKHGYLPDSVRAAGIALDARQVATSAVWGSPDRLKTLSDVPVGQATVAEADAYKRYVENYARYWRQYFDPVAVRLDDTPDGALEMTTFILPLLDSSIYNGLRRVVATRAQAAPMRLPQLAPAPVALFSLNLSEDVWLDFLDDFLRHGRTDFPGMNALDDLGPGFHFAIHDSDPIVAFGSGEMLGLGSAMGTRGNELLALPLVVSFLTRPSSIIIELKRADGVRELLRRGALTRLLPFADERDIRTRYYRLGEGDAWIYAIELFGINLRFRFEIEDNFLIISNLPWLQRGKVASVTPSMLGGLEVCVTPASALLQMPALYTAAAERQRQQAFEGLGYLAPLTLAGTPVSEAVARHAELFGFRPAHPEGGAWAADDRGLSSTLYGLPGDARQPEYPPGKADFGLLRGIRNLRVGLQFEDTGLRTCVRWTYAK